MPEVSVLIPAYNAALYIAEAISSVVAQTFKDFEIIVVDDGSTDTTQDVVGNFPEVRYFKQENAGAAAARNHAARLSRGRYLAFLDADDLWHPLKLSHQLSAFSVQPECVISHTASTRDRSVFEKAVQIDAPECKPVIRLRSLVETFLSPYLSTPTVMVRRAAFEKLGGYNENLRVAEDVDFHLRMLSLSPNVLALENKLAFVRSVPGSLSSDHAAGYYALIKVYQDFLSAHPELGAEIGRANIREAFYDLRIRLARSLVWAGYDSEARRTLRQAFTHKVRPDALKIYCYSFLRNRSMRGQ